MLKPFFYLVGSTANAEVKRLRGNPTLAFPSPASFKLTPSLRRGRFCRVVCFYMSVCNRGSCSQLVKGFGLTKKGLSKQASLETKKWHSNKPRSNTGNFRSGFALSRFYSKAVSLQLAGLRTHLQTRSHLSTFTGIRPPVVGMRRSAIHGGGAPCSIKNTTLGVQIVRSILSCALKAADFLL